MFKRINLTDNNFLLLNFEEDVYIQTITFRGKTFVKELKSIWQVKEILEEFL